MRESCLAATGSPSAFMGTVDDSAALLLLCAARTPRLAHAATLRDTELPGRSGSLGERWRTTARADLDARRRDEPVAPGFLGAIERGVGLLDPVLDVDHRDVRLGRAERAWAACSPVTAVRFVRCL